MGDTAETTVVVVSPSGSFDHRKWDMPTMQKNQYVIQSVEKALDVLEAISEVDCDVSITSLSKKLAFNKSTIFRLLATFEKRGYVERAVSGNYRIGMSAFETGRKLLACMGLLRMAKPLMEGLARKVNESVYLAVPAGQEVLMVDVVETTQQVQIMPLVGRRFPLENCSAGRVIQAYANTIDSTPEMDQIRREEVYIENDFFGAGISSLTVPLVSARNKVEGCLCFVGPTFRFGPERIRNELLPPLKTAGRSVSSQLGYLDYLID